MVEYSTLLPTGSMSSTIPKYTFNQVGTVVCRTRATFEKNDQQDSGHQRYEIPLGGLDVVLSIEARFPDVALSATAALPTGYIQIGKGTQIDVPSQRNPNAHEWCVWSLSDHAVFDNADGFPRYACATSAMINFIVTLPPDMPCDMHPEFYIVGRFASSDLMRSPQFPLSMTIIRKYTRRIALAPDQTIHGPHGKGVFPHGRLRLVSESATSALKDVRLMTIIGNGTEMNILNAGDWEVVDDGILLSKDMFPCACLSRVHNVMFKTVPPVTDLVAHVIFYDFIIIEDGQACVRNVLPCVYE